MKRAPFPPPLTPERNREEAIAICLRFERGEYIDDRLLKAAVREVRIAAETAA